MRRAFPGEKKMAITMAWTKLGTFQQQQGDQQVKGRGVGDEVRTVMSWHGCFAEHGGQPGEGFKQGCDRT